MGGCLPRHILSECASLHTVTVQPSTIRRTPENASPVLKHSGQPVAVDRLWILGIVCISDEIIRQRAIARQSNMKRANPECAFGVLQDVDDHVLCKPFVPRVADK